MPRRITLLLLAPVVTCALATPVFALHVSAGTTRVIAQKSAKKGFHSVYLAKGLTNGHRYRVEIVSTGKFQVTGYGVQNYAYVVNKHLSEGTKSFAVTGKTPFTSTVTAPVSAHLSEWTLAVDASISGKHGLTIRFRDLGKTG